MEILAAKLVTAAKTAADILAEYENESNPPTAEQAEAAAKAYRDLDGIEINVFQSFSKNFALYGWNPQDDEKIRDFIYYAAEQDAMFGSYVDEREEFLKDWANDNYEPAGSLVFVASDLTDFRNLSYE